MKTQVRTEGSGRMGGTSEFSLRAKYDAVRKRGNVSSETIGWVADGNVMRLRLRREVKTLGMHMQAPLYVETQEFLDGTFIKTSYSRSAIIPERENMGSAAIPVRSKDVLDFGRLETAVTSLTRQIMSHGPDNPPSVEQTEGYINSYQGILAWQSKAQEQLLRAEGQIDIVAAALRALVSGE